ncbi:hypothetical protein GCM10010136_33140 [Limoniibacter endophyticus]|uniref:Uncharacterized protein n=1 Tax=Limoniibacter endophyticus TaxID=1565040 RepID=A0A8J3DSL4_9HYPH|nr:hypothetical protein GCM10010136_33140 [Limoniibacter endophyticus]
MRIDARIVKDQIGTPRFNKTWQNSVQLIKVGAVTHAVGQTYVQRGWDFPAWVVALGMHREREDTRLSAENIGGPVTLVDVEVNDQNALHPALVEERAGRDRHVIEGAKACAMGASCMMATTCRVARNSMFKCKLPGHERTHARITRAPRDLLINLKTDFFFNRLRHPKIANLIDIEAIMGLGQQGSAGKRWRVYKPPVRKAQRIDFAHQKAVFAHRETMSRIELRIIGGVMNDVQWH